MRGWWHLTVFVALAIAAGAAGQVYQTQDGRALDSSYYLGSRGVNSIRRADRALDGNLLVTGQVTGGFGFRAGVGYVGSDQFRLELPSASLDRFISSSAGLDRIGSGSLYRPSPYFSPAATVVGAGGIAQGLNVPGTSIPRATYLPRPQARTLYESAVEAYKPILGDVGEQSRINPLVRPLEAPTGPGRRRAMGGDLVGEMGAARPAASSLFGILRREEQDRFAEEMPGEPRPERPPGLEEPMEGPARPRPRQQPSEQEPPAEAMPEPGQDVLLDVLRELERMRREQTGRAETSPRPERPARQTGQPEGEQEPEAVARVRQRLILHRLAGKNRDRFNLHMSQGEKALAEGKFYEASGHYDIAIVLNRANPLAHLGRALALFAAHEPLSSAVHLRGAMSRLPALMHAVVDVNRMVGAKVVEARIQRLEKRLAAQRDVADPDLLYLAAFIRSVTGQPQKAAAHAAKLVQRSSDEVHRAYAEALLKDAADRQPATQKAP